MNLNYRGTANLPRNGRVINQLQVPQAFHGAEDQRRPLRRADQGGQDHQPLFAFGFPG